MNEHFILENRYKVNSGAETVLNVLNTILFVVFILLSIAINISRNLFNINDALRSQKV